jgi:hypothetical protein
VKSQALYAANTDDGSIVRYDLDTGTVSPISVGLTAGAEPTRIAQVGSRVYVTLRAERAVAVLEETGSGLKVVNRIPTGAEPYGIVATESSIYVASSVQNEVTEYESTSFQVSRTWSIAGEPRWLTLHSSGKALYVGSAYGGKLSVIDLLSGTVHDVTLPDIGGNNFTDGTQILFTKRITGDGISAPDGSALYVPMLYVDNKSTIPDVTGDTTTPPPCEGPVAANGAGGGTSSGPNMTGTGGMTPPNPGGLGGCGGGYNSQKFNPTVTMVPVDSQGQPTNDPQKPAQAILLSGQGPAVFAPDARASNGAGGFVSQGPANGYAVALSISRDGSMVFAALEGAQTIRAMYVSVDPNGSTSVSGGGAPGKDAPPNSGVNTTFFSSRPTVDIATSGQGPRGIAIIDEQRGYVHAFFDHSIEQFDVTAVHAMLTSNNNGGPTASGIDKAGGGAMLGGPNNGFVSPGTPTALTTTNVRTIAVSTQIDPAVDQGRRLFYAANNPVMATVGAAVSCATCHFEGRTDGLTWTFTRGLRQTPMLAANLKDALPVGWAGNVATVADEGFNTSQKLMGGHGITPDQTASVQAFLFSLRTVDTPMKGSTDSHVAHGGQIFTSAGCISCHSGPSHTNNQVYSMLGLDKVKTRPLASIAASAPYFHDGSAESLGDVIDRASKGDMGTAFTITDADKADLILFLSSL